MPSAPQQPSTTSVPVFLTGFGAVCGLGMNTQEILRQLRAGRDASAEVTLFSTAGCHCTRAMEVPDAELAALSARHPETQRWHRVGRMLLQAALEAKLQAGGFTPQAAVFGTTSGGMSFGEDFFRHLLRGKPARELREEVRQYVPQQAAVDVLAFFGWPLVPTIISNACASGTNAVGHAWRLVSSGFAERVICGGYDALSQLVFAGFDSLRALTPDRCRPFDQNRSGLLLGEAAAVLFLESEKSAQEGGRAPLAKISGYGAATDLHHLTQPEPGGSGPENAMRAALAAANLPAEAIDYVNAHGTGTPHNDSSEGAAIARVLPDAAVSSTKSMTGHTLGAAGALEAVFCALALQHRFCPPQTNIREPDAALPLRLVGFSEKGSRSSAPKRVLSNSFGFGGSNASVILEEVSQ